MNQYTSIVQMLKDMKKLRDAIEGNAELVSNQGQALDGYSQLAEWTHIMKSAKNILDRT